MGSRSKELFVCPKAPFPYHKITCLAMPCPWQICGLVARWRLFFQPTKSPSGKQYPRQSDRQVDEQESRGLPYRTSTELMHFFTPSPLSARKTFNVCLQIWGIPRPTSPFCVDVIYGSPLRVLFLRAFSSIKYYNEPH